MGAALASHLEAKNFGFIVVDLRGQDHSQRVVLEEHMREASTEVGSINVNLAHFRKVHFFATRAVGLETGGAECVTQANREDLLSITESARASSKHCT
jgi:hypothetical protein